MFKIPNVRFERAKCKVEVNSQVGDDNGNQQRGCTHLISYFDILHPKIVSSQRKKISENISVEKTYSIKKVGGEGVKQDSEKKKVSVGLFSTFRHPLQTKQKSPKRNKKKERARNETQTSIEKIEPSLKSPQQILDPLIKQQIRTPRLIFLNTNIKQQIRSRSVIPNAGCLNSFIPGLPSGRSLNTWGECMREW